MPIIDLSGNTVDEKHRTTEKITKIKANAQKKKDETNNSLARRADDIVNKRQLTIDGEIPGGDLLGAYDIISTEHNQKQKFAKSKFHKNKRQQIAIASPSSGW